VVGAATVIPAALPVLRALPWEYIGAAIGAGLLIYAAYDWAYDRGHDSRNDEVATLKTERDTARDNVATLEGALAGQNKAIALAGQVTKQAQDSASLAAKQFDDRNRALDSINSRLDAVRPSGGRCVTPDVVQESWSKM
jgi:nitrogen fixation-related uncharacterized protein